MFDRRTFLRFIFAAVAIQFGKSEGKAIEGNDNGKAKIRIGLAYALGGKGDQSYNDAAARSLAGLRKNFDVKEFAPLTLDDYSKALINLARLQPAAIFCVGLLAPIEN